MRMFSNAELLRFVFNISFIVKVEMINDFKKLFKSITKLDDLLRINLQFIKQ